MGLARVLVGFVDGGIAIAPNAVVDGSDKLIKGMEKAGVVDSDKAAVAYAESLGAKPIKIKGDGVDVATALAEKEEAAKTAAAAADNTVDGNTSADDTTAGN